ncbi:ankyrin repeat domain-containing protein [Gorillibacterium sp. CAU 1737]|uniref:ankyrin repeat domain-containing protein n=1 Tax=Gorillibacterium sp. CAU 1737 TaxID=3140362 RepID=UPI003260AF4C
MAKDLNLTTLPYTKKELKDFYYAAWDAVDEKKKDDLDELLKKCPELFKLPYYSKPKSERDKNVIGKLVDIYGVSPDMIGYAIEKGADFNDLDETVQVPAFCYAILNPGRENLPVEMAKRMSYFRTDSFLTNPYFYAILTLNAELVQVLTEKGLDLSVPYESPFFEKVQNALSYAELVRDFFTGSPWQEEADRIYAEIARASRQQGISIPPASVSEEEKNRPLSKGELWFFSNVIIQALRKKNVAMVTYFASHARSALQERLFGNGTALHYACEKGSVEMIQAMIRAGADPLRYVKTSYNDMKLPAVGIAIAGSNVEVADYLLRQYPEAVVRDKKGCLLETAIRFSKDAITCELVKALVNAGARIDVYYEYQGWKTSVHPHSLAEKQNKPDVADYLTKVAEQQGLDMKDYDLRVPDQAEMATYQRYSEDYSLQKDQKTLVAKPGKRQKLKPKYAAFALNLRAALRVALEYARKHYANETAYQFTLAFEQDGASSCFWTVLSTEEDYAKTGGEESGRYIVEECGIWNLAEDAFSLLNSLLKKLPYDQDDYGDQVQEMALQCLEDIREEGLLEANNLGSVLLQYYTRDNDQLEQILLAAERLNPEIEELALYKNSMELFY